MNTAPQQTPHFRRGARRRLTAAAVTALLLAAGTVALTSTTASAAPGALDTTFGTSGTALQPAGVAGTGEVLDQAGNAVVSGGDGTNFQVSRFTPSGGVDTSFGTNGNGVVSPFTGTAYAVAVVPAGTGTGSPPANAGDIVAVGVDTATQTTCSGNVAVVVEIKPNGTLDTGFNNTGIALIGCTGGGFVDSSLTGVATDATGRIDVGGQTISANGTLDALAARFTPTGPDAAFGAAGVTTVGVASGNFLGGGVTLAPVGSGTAASPDLVLAGTSAQGSSTAPVETLTAVAFTATGALDDGFGTAGVGVSQTGNSVGRGITATAGGVVVAGSSTTTATSTTNRTLLTTFAPAGTATDGGTNVPNAQFQAVVVGVDGFLTAVGSTGTGASEQMLLAQYKVASPLAANTYFGGAGIATRSFTAGPSSLAAVASRSDGSVVAAGIAPTVNSAPATGVIRVLGPSVSITGLPTQTVYVINGSSSITTLSFPVTIDEILPVAINPLFCTATPAGTPAATIGGQTCGTVTIPAGSQQATLPVAVSSPPTVGTSSTVTVVAQSGGGVVPSPTSPAATVTTQHLAPTAATSSPGYWMVATDGGIFAYNRPFLGSTGNIALAKPMVGMAAKSDDSGYWLVASDGGIFAYNVPFFGSTGNIALAKPVVGMAATPDGGGYWLVASDGGIFAFGDAAFYGSTGNIRLAKPVVGMAATPDGKGYWLVASDGGIFAFGDAAFYGSTGNIALAKPVVGMAADPAGPGYWMVASDGGIFAFGAAGFHGSTGNIALAKPVVGMAATTDGQGYWFAASDGGIFNYGDAPFLGSAGALPLARPVVGIAS